MKVIMCNVTFAIEMSKKQFIKWDSLNESMLERDEPGLIKKLESGFDSILNVEWDLMTGPHLYITTDNPNDISLILQRVEFMLKSL